MTEPLSDPTKVAVKENDVDAFDRYEELASAAEKANNAERVAFNDLRGAFFRVVREGDNATQDQKKEVRMARDHFQGAYERRNRAVSKLVAYLSTFGMENREAAVKAGYINVLP